MEKIQIKNFRSIKDSGAIEIKPITVLLGKNSCGKSSFLRLLPLLKQTIEKDKQEPILWYGDNVDFGGFDDIMPKFGNKTNSFELSFELTLSLINNSVYANSIRSIWLFEQFIDPKKHRNSFNVQVKIIFMKKEISSLTLLYLDQKVEIKLKDNKIVEYIVNGNNCVEFSDYILFFSERFLLPEIIFNSSDILNRKRFFEYSNKEFDPAAKILEKNINTGIKSLTSFIQEIVFLQTKEELLARLINCKSKTISNVFTEKNTSATLLQQLNDQLQLIIIPALINRINQAISLLFNNVYYIKPIRANANRYYRVQGISVKKVDPDGSNVPMILYSMSKEKQEKFSKWCLDKLGIGFKVKAHEGHISLMVTIDKNYEINIADTGYGYSQMLPIILQSWLLIDKFESEKTMQISETIVVIEQPELHLHPAFQSKMIDIFVSLIEVMNKSRNRIKLLIETHSEAMINRLGELVSNNKILSNDINLVLVEKDGEVSNFKQTTYNNQGFIEEWPIGFLSAEK